MEEIATDSGGAAPCRHEATSPLTQAYGRAFFDAMGPLSDSSAASLAPTIIDLTKCQSVVDVGSGDGAWLERFSALHVSDFLGVDGPHVDPNRLKIPPKNFVA